MPSPETYICQDAPESRLTHTRASHPSSFPTPHMRPPDRRSVGPRRRRRGREVPVGSWVRVTRVRVTRVTRVRVRVRV